ncbi:helix-turn-helix domain-containing protein [Marinitenerispora sediminis]|uniref:MerR family transcriptional regulator n=1 Tax=Marinitenerispora sediminis TaxID=1931232 RepID=A0A368TAW7_9ACTN|nr:MerR family transcriptional regulator [Marinitenerispora sediminis]RCV52862.1 MerR family transcriptional regulator [Marinitenerispora sediminis]RCV60038.1 MerR family transcriptional regulator [Marinitenerispora sediminis]RCV61945.1 MerR family transcriptional regulator [Marinitenerispora sediminis]
MHDNELYPIGDAARRSGLSVSAVRFYADAGVIAPPVLTEGGHRLFDIRAIAQLELVRTLRDLGAGLDDIRRLLGGETTLHDLVVAHLELVERQERDLRARRAVLRALARQGGTVAQAALMHRLVSMSDDERERLIDEFWNEVSDGLDVNPDFVGRLREERPRLPEDPSAAQLDAWIELAHLVRHAEFRGAVRCYLQETYSAPPGRLMSATPVQDFIHGPGTRIMEEIMAAYRSGLPADAPRAQELAVRLADAAAGINGRQGTPGFRERMAAYFLAVEEVLREEPSEKSDAESRFGLTHGRYLSLVAAINGTPPAAEQEALPLAWMSAALRASVSGDAPGTAAGNPEGG